MDRQGIGMTSMRTRERLMQRLMDQGISSHAVLEVMRDTPRHVFVDEALAHRAYEDTALPIGWSQTLSQPYIVARMTELAVAEGKPDRVLEIGTGSGYQTAVLSPLVGQVYSIERIRGLYERARHRVRGLRLRNVQLRLGDGFEGWPDKGPFDIIMAAAAPEYLPESLLQQLAVGGRMLMPVGGKTQQLVMVRRTSQGFERESIEEVKFVPMMAGIERS